MYDLTNNTVCPTCANSKLETLTLNAGEDLMMDYCGNCSGVWFPGSELIKLRNLNPAYLRMVATLLSF